MNLSNLLIFNKLLIFIYYINKIKDIHITNFKYYFYWPKKGYYFYYLQKSCFKYQNKSSFSKFSIIIVSLIMYL